MKYNITKIIASVAFGLIVSNAAMASEEDYGEDIYVASNHAHKIFTGNTQEGASEEVFTVSYDDTHVMFNDDVSVIDMNYSSNN